VNPARAAKLRAIRDTHDAWVDSNAEAAGARFNPAAHPKPDSDYNQHNVDIDADGEQLDAFADAVAQALAPPPHRQP